MEKHPPESDRSANGTRLRIYRCATELFSQKSFEEVKITDICRAARVSVGAFYHYFPKKEDVIEEAYRSFDDKMRAAWETRPQLTLPGALLFLIRCYFDTIADQGWIYTLQFFKSQLGRQGGHTSDTDRFFCQKNAALTQQLLRARLLCGAADEICAGILRLSRGAVYDWCLHGGKYDLTACGMRDVGMLLDGYSLPRKAAE